MLLIMSILSGVFGRMGGAHGYNTKWRDLGCPAIFIGILTLLYGWHPWVYLLTFLMMWAALATYWDDLFGYDNFWFSGFMVGMSAVPIMLIDVQLFTVVMIRALFLCIAWGLIHKLLPQRRILCWDRAIVEEFTRYAVTL